MLQHICYYNDQFEAYSHVTKGLVENPCGLNYEGDLEGIILNVWLAGIDPTQICQHILNAISPLEYVCLVIQRFR